MWKPSVSVLVAADASRPLAQDQRLCVSEPAAGIVADLGVAVETSGIAPVIIRLALGRSREMAAGQGLKPSSLQPLTVAPYFSVEVCRFRLTHAGDCAERPCLEG